MWIVFDTTKEGFETVMRDWQEKSLRFIWEFGEKGVTSRDVWVHVNRDFEGVRTISRASIINFLRGMAREGVLWEEERTGKGGYHGVYKPRLSEEEFKRQVARTIISKLSETWPDATREALWASRTLGAG